MASKLYVGNLSYDTTEGDLRTLFEEAGTVTTCDVVIDRFTNRSRGFAFIEMGSQEDAQKAIELCNDKDLQGRNLVVNEARPREDRGGGGGGGGHREFRNSGPPGRGGAGGGYTKRSSGKGSRRGSRNAKRGGEEGW
jgi:RNA recognition motif-containing protein